MDYNFFPEAVFLPHLVVAHHAAERVCTRFRTGDIFLWSRRTILKFVPVPPDPPVAECIILLINFFCDASGPGWRSRAVIPFSSQPYGGTLTTHISPNIIVLALYSRDFMLGGSFPEFSGQLKEKAYK